MTDVYNSYAFLHGELGKTDYLRCMAHAKVKFRKTSKHGGDVVAKEFEYMISILSDLESGYQLRGLK